MKLIAETAWHHDGNFDFFRNLVKEITKNTQTDYIKFHITLNLDEYMHTDHPAYQWAKERIFTMISFSKGLAITTFRFFGFLKLAFRKILFKRAQVY